MRITKYTIIRMHNKLHQINKWVGGRKDFRLDESVGGHWTWGMGVFDINDDFLFMQIWLNMLKLSY